MKILNKFFTGSLILALSFGFSLSTEAATSINLGSASNFAVLAGSTITNTGSSVINGNLGLNPGTSVTGFPPGTVSGTQEVTNGVASQAHTDLITAYNAAAGQTGAVTVSGDLGGQTLVPGVYSSASSLGLTGTLTLDAGGDANAVFIFQAGSSLTTSSGSNVSLINGAQACNVFWQVGSSATLGTNSNMSGSILALTSITLNSGADVDGRVLARNGAVTLDDNTVTVPSCTVAAVETPTETATTTEEVVATSTPVVLAATTTLAVTSMVPFVGVTTVAPTMPNTGGTSTSFLPILIFSLSIGFIAFGVLQVNQKKS